MYFDKYAQQIAGGNLLGNEIFHKAPLYQYFLGLIYALFGHNYAVPRLIQVMMGSATTVLVFFTARKLFGRAAGWTAFVLSALNGVSIYFSGELLMPTLLSFFMLVSAAVFMKAFETKSLLLHFASGICFGLTSITRPNFLAPVFIFLLIITLSGKKDFIPKLALILAGLLITVLPVTIRNYAVGNDFVPISSQGGVIFYIGNNTFSDGMSAVIPGTGDDWDEIALAERETGKPMRPSEASNFWFKKALGEIAKKPGTFAKLMLMKILYFINGYEIPNNQNIYLASKGTYVSALVKKIPLFGDFWLYVPSGIIVPMGISGMFLAFFKKRKTSVIPALLILSYSASIIVFCVFSRLRAPLLQFFTLFAAFFAVTVIREANNKKISVPSSLLFLAFLGISNYRFVRSEFSSAAMYHFNLGLKYYAESDFRIAASEFQNCLRLEPGYPRANLNLGLISYNTGDLKSAEKFYELEILYNPNEARSYNNLAVLYSRMGHDSLSVENWKKAVYLNPRYTEARLNLGAKYENLGFQDSALNIYLSILSYDKFSETTYSGIARIYQRKGLIKESAENYEKAISINPENHENYFNYSLLYSESADYGNAIRLLEKSVGLRPDFAAGYNNLGLCFFYSGEIEKALLSLKKAVSLDYQSVQTHLALAMVYESIGETDSADSERTVAASLTGTREDF
ncbi:glycosyltransferase family 39 protein [candidate division WOR-3 bacterium]|nr:glycosyltransferase family 39 protein [candidate division WOR-3 bacterium]